MKTTNAESKRLADLGLSIKTLKSDALIDPDWCGSSSPIIRHEVELSINGNHVLTQEYSQGIGHYPELNAMLYKGESVDSRKDNLKWMCRGRERRKHDEEVVKDLLKNWGKKPHKITPQLRASLDEEEMERRVKENTEYRKKQGDEIARIVGTYYKNYDAALQMGKRLQDSPTVKQDVTILLSYFERAFKKYDERIPEMEAEIKQAEEDTEAGVKKVIDSFDGTPVDLELADFCHCVFLDAVEPSMWDDFEDWAMNYGYDTDSRKAEKIFNACVEVARQLYMKLPESTINQAREILQDY